MAATTTTTIATYICSYNNNDDESEMNDENDADDNTTDSDALFICKGCDGGTVVDVLLSRKMVHKHTNNGI